MVRNERGEKGWEYAKRCLQKSKEGFVTVQVQGKAAIQITSEKETRNRRRKAKASISW